jgi:hypothetical protein
MKTFFTRVFVVLGVLFLCIICAGVYLWFADPYELRPLIERYASSDTKVGDTSLQKSITGDESPSDKHPALTTEQERALESIGVDPATLPTSLTKEQVLCAKSILGEARSQEIQKGAVPTTKELFSIRSCL